MPTRHTHRPPPAAADDPTTEDNRREEVRLDAQARAAVAALVSPAPAATPATPPEDTPQPPATPDTQAPPDVPDGSTPLTGGHPPGRHESYAQLRANKATPGEAYQSTAAKRVKHRTAVEAASRFEGRADIARRIAWLTTRVRTGKPDTPATQPPESTPKQPKKPIKELSRDSVLQALTLALNSAVDRSASNEIASIVKQISVYLPSTVRETTQDMPDPLAVVTYLVSAADRRPSDIRRELGGMEWILGRMQALTRCPPDQFATAAQTVADTVALREAKRVRR